MTVVYIFTKYDYNLKTFIEFLPKFVGGAVTPGATMRASSSDSADVEVLVEFLDFEPPRSDELKGVGVTGCEEPLLPLWELPVPLWELPVPLWELPVWKAGSALPKGSIKSEMLSSISVNSLTLLSTLF